MEHDLFPPLRAMWAEIGRQARVRVTGQNAKRVLFGTINLRTARRTVHLGRGVGTQEVREFLRALRSAYRGHDIERTQTHAKAQAVESSREFPALSCVDHR